MKPLYIFEYEDILFCYSAFVVAENKEEADELVKEDSGVLEVVFVKKHILKKGLVMEGGGNG